MSNLTNNRAWSKLTRIKCTKMTSIEQKEIPCNTIFLYWSTIFIILEKTLNEISQISTSLETWMEIYQLH